ncbi:hypothetical protein Agabi119p4_10041 [Agaricus bisporus var. burnettii]|uniref:Uncharacterized protein n=1 Tax=Agaricus bisporus var. burnettii TaxID=192524 RepID=A0A8H7EW75_AGABI|nr:hypothetical protein Agabi119p4_10041 [Agaricus bisporus var. burnettii]
MSSNNGLNSPSASAVSLPTNPTKCEKKKVNKLATMTNTQLTELGRILTQKDAAHAMVTISRTHKPNFSLSSFMGGTPMDTNLKRHDPSLRSSSGVVACDLDHGHPEYPESEIQVPEPDNKLGRLRTSSSSMSLKLKIPRFTSLIQQKSKDSDGQSPASLTSNTPLSMNESFKLGTMPFQRTGSADLTSPDSQEDVPTSTHLPSYPTTSMTLRNDEESGSPTQRSITDTNLVLTPGQPLHEANLPFLHDSMPSSAIHSVKTQDDMALDVYSANHKDSHQLIRRASLSTTTTNLMSFSESLALPKTPRNSSSLRPDYNGANRNPINLEFLTRENAGNSESKSTGPAPSTSPILQYLTEDSLTPTALFSPSMKFPAASDETSLHHSSPPVREFMSSSGSRTPTSDSGVSTPQHTSMSSLYTTSSISSRPQQNKATPAQVAQWREDEENIMAGLDDEFDGEVCLLRFEPKQGWFGFWNKEDVVEVIGNLRGLRSPKP